MTETPRYPDDLGMIRTCDDDGQAEAGVVVECDQVTHGVLAVWRHYATKTSDA